MNILSRKMIRELWKMKFRAILIVLSIALAISMYGGLLLMKSNAMHSLETGLAQYNYEDAGFRFFGYPYISNVSDIAPHINNINQFDYRLSLKTIVHTNNEDFSGIIHGIDKTHHPYVNDINIIDGSFFDINKSDQVIVELHFAKLQNISVGDTIHIKTGGKTLAKNVIGIAFSPEYKYVVNPNTGFPEPGTYSPLWMDIDEVQSLLHFGEVINEFFITVKDKSKLDTTIQKIDNYLENKGMSAISCKGVDEADYVMMVGDVGAIDSFAKSFSIIVLIVAVFIIYDAITKLIASQKTLIGIMRAMGAKKSKIMLHYQSFGIFLSTLGIIIGIPLGYLITYGFVEGYTSYMSLNFVEISDFNLLIFLPSIVLAYIMAIVTGFLATGKITKLEPVDAIADRKMESGFKGAKIVDYIFSSINKRSKYTTIIPIRHIFGRKRRSILTALTIAIAALIIMTSFGFIDSFNNQMNAYFNSYNKSKLNVFLTQPVDLNDYSDVLDGINGIKQYEGYVMQGVEIQTESNNFTTALYAYSQSSSIRNVQVPIGNFSKDDFVIGSAIAYKYNISIGDKLIVKGVNFTDYSPINHTYTVKGISKELFDIYVFLHLLKSQNDFGLNKNITSIAITLNSDADISSIKKAILQSDLPVESLQDIQQSITAFNTLIQGLFAVLGIALLIGFFVLLVISLNVILLDIMERDREFVNIRTAGGSRWKITKVIVLQTLLLFIIMLILIYFISPLATKWLIDETMATFGTLEVFISFASYIMGGFITFIGLGTGLYFAIKHVMNISLVLLTRLRFRT